jgi:hypothetical protein
MSIPELQSIEQKQRILNRFVEMRSFTKKNDEVKQVKVVFISKALNQEMIENEYQTSLNTLLPIKTQLKNCDNLIDEIVYQLYGLTLEEKAIIENSLNK